MAQPTGVGSGGGYFLKDGRWSRLGWTEMQPHLTSERFGSTPSPHLSRHLFAIANLAFAKMLDAKQNQCIIIR